MSTAFNTICRDAGLSMGMAMTSVKRPGYTCVMTNRQTRGVAYVQDMLVDICQSRCDSHNDTSPPFIN